MADKPSTEQLDNGMEHSELERIEWRHKLSKEELAESLEQMIKELEEGRFIFTPPPIRCRLRDHGPIILDIIEEALYR
jgi:hypothetical protein